MPALSLPLLGPQANIPLHLQHRARGYLELLGGIIIFENKNMILTTFQRAIPHRLPITILFVLFCTLATLTTNTINEITVGANTRIALDRNGHGEVPSFPLLGTSPDVTTEGYAPEQIRIWYKLIGEEGRKQYIKFAILDFITIALYALMLGSQLLYKQCPTILCYFPAVTAVFDIIETSTHTYACHWHNTQNVDRDNIDNHSKIWKYR